MLALPEGFCFRCRSFRFWLPTRAPLNGQGATAGCLAKVSSNGMGGRRGILRSRTQRYFASQNANQRRSPRPMTIVVQMTCPFVDTETVQPRHLGWSTHNVGNCGRPINQTDSAAGELLVHG